MSIDQGKGIIRRAWGRRWVRRGLLMGWATLTVWLAYNVFAFATIVEFHPVCMNDRYVLVYLKGEIDSEYEDVLVKKLYGNKLSTRNASSTAFNRKLYVSLRDWWDQTLLWNLTQKAADDVWYAIPSDLRELVKPSARDEINDCDFLRPYVLEEAPKPWKK